MLLVLLTRVLLWASVGVLIWYILARIIPQKYLTLLGGFILILLLVLSFIEPDDGTVRVIWQILSFPLSPLGAAIVFMGFALSDGVKGIKGQPVAIALTILLLASIPLSAQWLVSDAERSVRKAFIERAELCEDVCRIDQVPGGNLGEAATIVVFGDSSDIDKAIDVASDTSDNVSINTALAPRLIYAAGLYRESVSLGGSPVVMVTAGVPDSNENQPEPNQRRIIRNILNNNGVPASAIQIESTGLNIRSASLKVETLLQDRGAIRARGDRTSENIKNDPRVVIVAPAILMSRAALSFEKMKLQVIAKPTDFYTARFATDASLLNNLPDLLPSVDALQLTTKYWNELLTSLYYFLRGWLPNFNFGWDSSIEI